MTTHSLSIENISATIGRYISAKTGNQHQENLLIYGAEVVLGSMLKIILVVTTSSLLGMRNEMLIIVFAAGMFRLLTGGAHASSYYRCLVSSLIIFTSLGYLFNVSLPCFTSTNSVHFSPFLLSGFIWVLRYAPIPPENKPLKREKDYRNRKVYACLIYLTISGLFYYTDTIWWMLAVSIGIIWQSFTLTQLGHRLIIGLDSIMTNSIRKGVEVYENVY